MHWDQSPRMQRGCFLWLLAYPWLILCGLPLSSLRCAPILREAVVFSVLIQTGEPVRTCPMLPDNIANSFRAICSKWLHLRESASTFTDTAIAAVIIVVIIMMRAFLTLGSSRKPGRWWLWPLTVSSKRIIYLECPLLGLRLVFRREFKMNWKVPSPACRSSPVPGAQTLNHTGRPYICLQKEESIETQYLKAAPNLSFLLTAYKMLENSSPAFL